MMTARSIAFGERASLAIRLHHYLGRLFRMKGLAR
jgi:hypothetical protein